MKKLWLLAAVVLLCGVMLAVGVSAAWSGTAADGFAGGTGTADDPYQIATAEQLAYLAESVNSGTTYEKQYIQLTEDIVLNDTTAENWTSTAKPWKPIGNYTNDSPFMGTFDGDGYTISGLYIYALDSTTWQNHLGLFGYTCNAEIKNVNIANADITGVDSVGALVGYAYYYINNTDAAYLITECTVKDSRIVGQIYVGGLIGRIDKTEYIGTGTLSVTSCNNINSTVVGTSRTGGIAGDSSSSTYFTECTNSGDISASDSYAGGIIGSCSSSVSFTGCMNHGSVTVSHSYSHSYAGGIAGWCYSCDTF